MENQNKQSNSIFFIISLVVVLALGILVGMNINGRSDMIGTQQGAASKSQYVNNLQGKPNSDICKVNQACIDAGNGVAFCDNLYPCTTKPR